MNIKPYTLAIRIWRFITTETNPHELIKSSPTDIFSLDLGQYHTHLSLGLPSNSFHQGFLPKLLNTLHVFHTQLDVQSVATNYLLGTACTICLYATWISYVGKSGQVLALLYLWTSVVSCTYNPVESITRYLQAGCMVLLVLL
jgi:hypothetical protein